MAKAAIHCHLMTVWRSPYKIIIVAIGPSVACVNDTSVIHDRNKNSFAVEHRPKFPDQAMYPVLEVGVLVR